MPITKHSITRQKLSYLLWAASRLWSAKPPCPGCGQNEYRILRSKYGVIFLCECSNCSLRFRLPIESPTEAEEFYQTDYQVGFTTDCPSPEELNDYVDSGFKGTPKDFSRYIEVLRGIPLPEGSRVLDYGCSWGYGSFQLRQAGYQVSSLEISAPRRAYAQQMLGCEVVLPSELPSEHFDCVFSSHVIEHMREPSELFAAARASLRLGGYLVLFCPNGAPEREVAIGKSEYDKVWGQVHPLCITPSFLEFLSKEHGLESIILATSKRPDVSGTQVAGAADRLANGGEITMIAHRV